MKKEGMPAGTQREVCCNPLHSIIPAPFVLFPFRFSKERMKYGFHSKLAALSQMHISCWVGMPIRVEEKKKFLI